MTRKDFTIIADALLTAAARAELTNEQAAIVAATFARELACTNAQFDAARFISAATA